MTVSPADAPADHDARRRALAVDASFTVVAPAGSGKTGLLTQRLLALLATVDAPEQILCMTFTRKAAAEMRRRVLEALAGAGSATAPTDPYARDTWALARAARERERAAHWQLQDTPQRLRIQTIDSFCRDLARALPVQSGFAELPEPAEDAEAHYRAAARALLAELDSPDTERATADALETLLAHLDNDLPRLEALLVRLLGRREQWLPQVYASRDARALLEDTLAHLQQETHARVRRELAPVASDLALLADYAAGNLGATNAELAACRGLTELPDPASAAALAHTQWRGILQLLLTQAGDWRRSIDTRLGFPTAAGAADPALARSRKQLWQQTLEFCRAQRELLALLEDLRALPATRYDDTQWRILAALTTLLPRLAARLQLVFRAERRCDFSAITLAALAALGDEDQPSDLVLGLDARIQHILVDECQDTSSIQFALLRRLTAGWQPGDGRTLFLVGDGMQSLYGFRNANVGLFLDAREHAVGGAAPTPLDLSANFRSQAGVVDWVNRLFARAFPPLPDIGRGAVPYVPAQPVKPLLAGAAVTMDCFVGAEDPLAEAEAVADAVASARAENPGGSIAILVRSRPQLQQILPALARRGLRWQGTDLDPLGARMPVLDLLSLTRALLCPAERIPWLAVLRAPWCGLDLADLLAVATGAARARPQPAPDRWALLLAQIQHHQSLPGLSPSGRRILDRVGAVLTTAWRERRRRPLRSWIEGTWIALGGPAALGGTEALADCQRYFDLLERHSEASADGSTIADWPGFVAAVDRLYAAPTADADPGLQIMTIHKAKGLEFDTVILPGLHRGGRNDDAELLLWAERVSAAGATELLIAAPQQLGGPEDSLYRYLKRERTLRRQLENTRVLYVACTRAVRHLHLVFRAPAANRSPPRDSLLAPLWPLLAEEIASPPPTLRVRTHALAPAATDEEPGFDLRQVPTYSLRLPAAWENPVLGTDAGRRALDAPAPIAPIDADATALQWDARHTGTLLHRALRQVVVEGLAAWDAARIARQRAAWNQQLRELGVADLAAALRRIESALVRCLADPVGQWLLDPTHAESACELALGYVAGDAADADGSLRSAVIDRTFVADGARWIIDYKSATPAAGETLPEFLARGRERYRGQLEGYGRLFSAPGELPVRLALYYPLLPHLDLLELDAGSAPQ